MSLGSDVKPIIIVVISFLPNVSLHSGKLKILTLSNMNRSISGSILSSIVSEVVFDITSIS